MQFYCKKDHLLGVFCCGLLLRVLVLPVLQLLSLCWHQVDSSD